MHQISTIEWTPSLNGIESDIIKITYDDGYVTFTPYPAETYIKAHIDAWIEQGNSIPPKE